MLQSFVAASASSRRSHSMCAAGADTSKFYPLTLDEAVGDETCLVLDDGVVLIPCTPHFSQIGR
jgi:hypothetical protein